MILIQEENFNDKNIQRWIRWMDAEVFPDDKPVAFSYGSRWFVGYSNQEPVCYAAWRPHYPQASINELHLWKSEGFLYRAGVLKDYRGHGLQKKLIESREIDMRKSGVRRSVTYTDPESAASMRS